MTRHLFCPEIMERKLFLILFSIRLHATVAEIRAGSPSHCVPVPGTVLWGVTVFVDEFEFEHWGFKKDYIHLLRLEFRNIS
jgi:hypothetical protein